MTNECNINVASTTTIKMDGGSKICYGNKNHQSNKEMLFNPTPSKALTCHLHLTIETSDDEHREDLIDITRRSKVDRKG